MSILIVDDSATQRLLMTSLLKTGVQIPLVAVDAARAAFEHLAGPDGGAVELILMDISMPDIDGIAACGRIKATPGLEDIPILMVTASTEADELEQAFAAGGLDYITKPLNKTELLARVRSALRLNQEISRRKACEQELARLRGAA
jgi:CheY-like chemotaxis protein